AGEQLIEQHAQGIDVAACVHAQSAHLGLFGRHVFEGADDGAELRKHRPLGQALLYRLRHAKIDHLARWFAVVKRYQDVRGLDVAVDDSFLVGVLDRLANRDEQLQALARRQVVVVAVFRNGDAVDQLHGEVGPAGRRGAGIEYARDMLVIHQRQRLTLRLETGNDLGGVHPRLDDLEGDAAAHRLLLLGHVNKAKAAFADSL